MGQGNGKVQFPLDCRPDCRCEENRPGPNDEFDEDMDKFSSNAVLLNVYDLDEKWLEANDLFQDLDIGGCFHAGVEVYGNEWSFSPDGVCYSCPRRHDVHVFRTAIHIGYTKYSQEEIIRILEDEMCFWWDGGEYDLLSRKLLQFCTIIRQTHLGPQDS